MCESAPVHDIVRGQHSKQGCQVPDYTISWSNRVVFWPLTYPGHWHHPIRSSRSFAVGIFGYLILFAGWSYRFAKEKAKQSKISIPSTVEQTSTNGICCHVSVARQGPTILCCYPQEITRCRVPQYKTTTAAAIPTCRTSRSKRKPIDSWEVFTLMRCFLHGVGFGDPAQVVRSRGCGARHKKKIPSKLFPQASGCISAMLI